MIGCLRKRVCKQPIIALYFEFEIELQFYNLEAFSEVINFLAYSTQLIMKFQLHIKIKMVKNKSFLVLKLLDVVVIMLINVKMPTHCWHFNIHEHDKFLAQLS